MLRESLRWNPKNEIRVGRNTEPGRTLAPGRDTVEITRHLEHVRDDLHVDVRPPVAVCRRCTDRGEPLPRLDSLSDLQPFERSAIEVTVQRVETRRLIAGNVVTKDEDRSVVETLGRILEPVNNTVERRK